MFPTKHFPTKGETPNEVSYNHHSGGDMSQKGNGGLCEIVIDISRHYFTGADPNVIKSDCMRRERIYISMAKIKDHFELYILFDFYTLLASAPTI